MWNYPRSVHWQRRSKQWVLHKFSSSDSKIIASCDCHMSSSDWLFMARAVLWLADCCFLDYTTFLTIPAGSQNIHVKELRSSSSFIAVKSGSHYYLNGRWSMDWPGKFNFAGSKFVYNRLYSGLEMLYSSGPTNETLDIQVLSNQN